MVELGGDGVDEVGISCGRNDDLDGRLLREMVVEYGGSGLDMMVG